MLPEMKALLTAALPALLIACGLHQAATPPQPAEEFAADSARLAALWNEIQALAGESRCSADRHCRALPIGAKPCGGPWSYLIYSQDGIDSAQFQAKVREHRALESALNRRSLAVSDCEFIAPPERLACRQEHCVDLDAAAPLRAP